MAIEYCHTHLGHNGQTYRVTNDVDDDGNPHGGSFSGMGISISYQRGPVMGTGREPNGAFVEDGIAANIYRLAFYQGEEGTGGDGRFACDENAMALKHLRAAHAILLTRTERRQAQGVEGQHMRHVSADEV